MPRSTRRPERVVKLVLHRNQIAGDQREQIARLRMRIGPGDAMPAVAGVLDRAGIAVRQHDRHARRVGGDRGGEARHHVGPVGKIGDAAEAFRLALGEEAAVRRVEAGQLRVVLRRDARFDLQRRGVRHVGDEQLAVLEHVAVGAEFLAVQRDAQQRQRLAVQRQRRAGVHSTQDCAAPPGASAPASPPRRDRTRARRYRPGMPAAGSRPAASRAAWSRRSGIDIERHGARSLGLWLRSLPPLCHCERSEAISSQLGTTIEIAASLRSSQ